MGLPPRQADEFVERLAPWWAKLNAVMAANREKANTMLSLSRTSGNLLSKRSFLLSEIAGRKWNDRRTQKASRRTCRPACRGRADVATLIATVLVKEVLPALDEISEQVKAGHYRLMYADMAIAQIGVIYEHLQDLASPKKRGLLGQERLHWQERLEKVTKQLEGTAKL